MTSFDGLIFALSSSMSMADGDAEENRGEDGPDVTGSVKSAILT